MTTRGALAVWTLALFCFAGAIAVILSSDHTDSKATTIALAVPTGLMFVISGLAARARRPENRTGALLVTVGLAWSLGALPASNEPVLFTLGLALGSLFIAVLVHLLLAFPTGRLESRGDTALVAATYGLVTVGSTLVYLFQRPTSCDGPCPDNVLLVADEPALGDAAFFAFVAVAVLLTALLLLRLTQRWRGASPALRRALSPVYLTGLAFIAAVVVVTAIAAFSEELAESLSFLGLGALMAVPLSFLYGLLRPRIGAATRRLVAELSEKRRPVEVQAVLRRVLRDPELRLGIPEGDGYVDVDGLPLELPADGSGRTVTYVGDEVIVHDVALLDQPELEAVRDAAQIALERGITLRSLETSERRGTAVLDAIPDNVFRVRADGTFLEAHVRRNIGVFGGPEAFIGRTLTEVMPPDVAPKLVAALNDVLATGDPARVEYALSYEGRPIHIEARIAKSGDEEVVAITRDVTELKESEEALRSLAEGRAALSRVAVAVATAERPESVFDIVTEEVARLLGADAANLVRFNELDHGAVIVGKWSEPGVRIGEPGTRVELDGGPLDRLRLTGQPTRGTPDDPDVSPRLAARLRELGVTSLVAAPIAVSGSLWGAVVVSVTGDKAFAEDDEERIGEFANLVAVALATAEAREQLAGLAEGRAALSRVAVAVATATSPESVFGVVTEEVGRLFRADAANLIRFDRLKEDEALIVGRWSTSDIPLTAVGEQIQLLGGAVTQVRKTGRPARGYVEDRARTEPELHARLTEMGISSYVAAPIEVGGELWGSVVVWLRSDDEFPADAEERLVQFGRLVSVALANTQAREELATLADEQAALRRVAVAVATEANPELLFDTVSEEVGRLLGARSAATVRYVEGEKASVIVGGWSSDGDFDRTGVVVPFQSGAISRVYDSKLPERVDIADMTPAVQERMKTEGVSSQVAAPIVVSGRLWGATSVSTGPTERFAPDAEERLGKFTNLVAVALANAEARDSLAALAREQAALSRVAVAVATEQTPDRLFDVVTEEVARLVGAHAGSTVRYLDDSEEVMVVGNWQIADQYELQKGERFPLGGGAITKVKETGLPARTDYELRGGGHRQMVAAPIVVSGRLWGASTVSVPAPETFAPDVEARLEAFTRLVAVALANAEAREQLSASRARIVQAGDAERRRLERNLHDGAQQRLVSLALALRLAQSRLPQDPAGAKELLERASEELAVGLEELRELARGIHPAILTDRGLAPAVEALAARASLPVELQGLPSDRLPEPIEAAAFYVVAESLTNVAKYASAKRARVEVACDDGLLVVEVSDDGIGGADASRGSGLRGLADRIEALEGRLLVKSEPGAGTTVRAELPLAPSREYAEASANGGG